MKDVRREDNEDEIDALSYLLEKCYDGANNTRLTFARRNRQEEPIGVGKQHDRGDCAGELTVAWLIIELHQLSTHSVSHLFSFL